MCCLRYEHEFYVQSRKRFPKEGKVLATTRGEEKVLANDIFRDRVTLRALEGGETRVVALADLRRELADFAEGGDGLAAGVVVELPAEDDPGAAEHALREDGRAPSAALARPEPSSLRRPARERRDGANGTGGSNGASEAADPARPAAPPPRPHVPPVAAPAVASLPAGVPAAVDEVDPDGDEADDLEGGESQETSSAEAGEPTDAPRPRRRRGRRGGRRGRGGGAPGGTGGAAADGGERTPPSAD
jgi:hypothetical protein